MKKSKISIIVRLLTVSLLLLVVPHPLSVQLDSALELPVPRNETVILYWTIGQTFLAFDSFNPFISGGVEYAGGWRYVYEQDWYQNLATGVGRMWRITGWEYQDNFTTLVWHVRKGVTWNDGEPYTAKDIVFTVNMIKNNSLLLDSAWAKEWIKSIEATDNYTAVFHFNKPAPSFHLDLLGKPRAIVPEHVWRDKDPTTFKNNPPVVTGAWKLKKTYPELQMFVWQRNDNYWGKQFGYFPANKYIVVIPSPPKDVMYADFIRGDVDNPILYAFSWDLVKTALIVKSNMTTASFNDPNPWGLRVNCGKYPLNLTEVRWAISYCINRQRLVDLYVGFNAPNTTISKVPLPAASYPAVLSKYGDMANRAMQRIKNEYNFTYTYNLTKAAQILNGLNFIDRDGDGVRETPNGTKLSWEICTTTPDRWQYAEASVIAEDLRKVGIDAKLRVVDSTLISPLLRMGTWDISAWSATGSGLSTTNNLLSALEPLQSKYSRPIGVEATGGSGYLRYQNPELDSIVQNISLLLPDDLAISQLEEQGMYLLLRDLTAITIMDQTGVSAFSTDYWTGWPSDNNLYESPYAWQPTFLFVLLNLKPVTVPSPVVVTYVSVWTKGTIAKFNGTDGKTYGGFVEGEYITIPSADANRLATAGLVSTTAPYISEIRTALSDLKTASSAISAQNVQLSSQLTTLTIVSELEAVVMVILAIGLVLALRKTQR